MNFIKKFRKYLHESEDSKEQSRWDKTNTDINKDWDPPSKKQLPLKKEAEQKVKLSQPLVDFLEEYVSPKSHTGLGDLFIDLQKGLSGYFAYPVDKRIMAKLKEIEAICREKQI